MITYEKFWDHQLMPASGEVAPFYPRTFDPLGNFAAYMVEWPAPDDEYADWRPTTLWPTSEHAYQAARFMQTAPELSEAILVARSAHIARRIGMDNKDRQHPAWDEIKYGVMLSICRAKLMMPEHEYLRELLEGTGDARPVEDSPRDSYWGLGPADENGERNGKNMLGEIWMELRDELRAGTIQPQ